MKQCPNGMWRTCITEIRIREASRVIGGYYMLEYRGHKHALGWDVIARESDRSIIELIHAQILMGVHGKYVMKD